MPRKQNAIPYTENPELQTVEEYLFRKTPPEWFVSGLIKGLLCHIPKVKHGPIERAIDSYYKFSASSFPNLSDGSPLWEDREKSQVIAHGLRKVQAKRGMPPDHDHRVVSRHATIASFYVITHKFPIDGRKRTREEREHWLSTNLLPILKELKKVPCICRSPNRVLKDGQAEYEKAKGFVQSRTMADLTISLVAYHHKIEPGTVRKILYPKKMKVDFSDIAKVWNRCTSLDEFMRQAKKLHLAEIESE